jgi:hypothetical protein
MGDFLTRILRWLRTTFLPVRVVDEIFADLAAIEAHLCRQDLLLMQLLERTRPAAPRAIFRVVTQDGIVMEGVIVMEMKVNQEFLCTVAFEDQYGNPAIVDTAPVWTVDPPGIVTVAPTDSEGLEVMVQSATTTGSAQILCKADADLGSGVTEITGTLTVVVLPGDAVMVRLNPGDVTDTS